MGYGADEIYTRFAMRSLPLWKELFAEAGRPELFHKTGVLWIAPDKYQYAIDSLSTLQNNGVGCDAAHAPLLAACPIASVRNLLDRPVAAFSSSYRSPIRIE